VARSSGHDQTLSISSSIGLAFYPDHGHDAIELARQADTAVDQGKKGGRDQLMVSQPDGGDSRLTGD
jgi:GGDEF domain-containing protein